MSTEYKEEELRRAARDGRIDDVRKYLNDNTVDVNEEDKWGCTALPLACRNGHRDVAELLLDHGADINATTDNGYTPLTSACANGHTSITRLLLDRDCSNVNAVDDDGVTALHKACWEGSTECVKELLAHGADTSIKNKDGETPLDIARNQNHKAVIALLLPQEKKHTDLTTVMSKLNSLDAKVTECVTSTSGERLSSNMVTTIIDERCDRLKRDMIESQEEMKKLTSNDLEAKVEQSINHRSTLLEDKMSLSFETLTNQLIISNAAVAKCISDLSTMMRHLSSKVDANEEKVNQLLLKRKEEMTTSNGESYDDVSTNCTPLCAFGDEMSHQEDNGGGDSIEKESLNSLKSIQEELRESLSYCQTMLS